MKLVREHINEKFIEDSDPIHDMGIGLKFAHIKPGSIIQVKKQMYIVHPVIKGGNGKYELSLTKSNDYVYRLNIGYFSIVTNTKWYKSGKLYLEAIPFSNMEKCNELQDMINNNNPEKYGYDKKWFEKGNWKRVYAWYYSKYDIKTWEEYFKVVDENR